MSRPVDIHAIIARQDGSAAALERCAVLMRVIAGELTMEAAAAEVGLSTQRLHELRERMTAVAVATLEPQAPGSNPRHLVARQPFSPMPKISASLNSKPIWDACGVISTAP